MELWGCKTNSLFDVWSFEHFAVGISIGALVHFFHTGRISEKDHKYICIIFVLMLAYIWEGVEYYLEDGATGSARITFWFQGVEFWGNRLVTDPLMVVGGHLLATVYPVLIWPARVFSLIWFVVHVFVFPHCMYLQERWLH
jgi:hypothetical protein